MRIGAVSERLDMPASTIRYYERIGLIEPQRRVSGRRAFDERALLLLRFIKLAQSAGFTIGEIKALLESNAEDPSPSGMWKPLAEAKRQAIRQQIEQLRQTDRILAELLRCDCSALEDCVSLASDARRRAKQPNP